MPKLNHIKCSVELGSSRAKLKEYGARYSDGAVEVFIPVPETKVPFCLHIETEGYIAPGLAVFVFMDGQYQCNRNRLGLPMPGDEVPPSKYEVDMVMRQKEEKTVTGHFVGREWTFAELNTTKANGAENLNPNFMQNVGTIEIVVLRCRNEGEDVPTPRLGAVQPAKEVLKLKSAKGSVRSSPAASIKSPSVKVKPASPAQSEAFGGMMGLFDGACDEPEPAQKKKRVDIATTAPGELSGIMIAQMDGGGDDPEPVLQKKPVEKDGSVNSDAPSHLTWCSISAQMIPHCVTNHDLAYYEQHLEEAKDSGHPCVGYYEHKVEKYKKMGQHETSDGQHMASGEKRDDRSTVYRPGNDHGYNTERAPQLDGHGNPPNNIQINNVLGKDWAYRGRNDMEGDKYFGYPEPIRHALKERLREQGDVVSESRHGRREDVNQGYRHVHEPQVQQSIQQLHQEPVNEQPRPPRKGRAITVEGALELIKENQAKCDQMNQRAQACMHQAATVPQGPEANALLQETGRWTKKAQWYEVEIENLNKFLQEYGPAENAAQSKLYNFKAGQQYAGQAPMHPHAQVQENYQPAAVNDGWQQVGAGIVGGQMDWKEARERQITPSYGNDAGYGNQNGNAGVSRQDWAATNNAGDGWGNQPDAAGWEGQKKDGQSSHRKVSGQAGGWGTGESKKDQQQGDGWSEIGAQNGGQSGGGGWAHGESTKGEPQNGGGNGWGTPASQKGDQDGGGGWSKSNSKKSEQQNGGAGGWGSTNSKDNRQNGGNDAWGNAGAEISQQASGNGGWGNTASPNDNNKQGGYGSTSRKSSNNGWGGDDQKAEQNNGGGGGWGGSPQGTGQAGKDGANSWNGGEQQNDRPKSDANGWNGSSHHKSPSVAHSQAGGWDNRSVSSGAATVKPYWADWRRSSAPHEDPNTKRKCDVAREVYNYPASPLPLISAAKRRDGASYGVQAGKGANYSHRTHRPKYMDTMAAPYAVFSFKYRTKGALEKILRRSVDIHEVVEKVEEDRLLHMPKHKLVEELMKARAGPHKPILPKASSSQGGPSAESKPASNGWGVQSNHGGNSQADKSVSKKGGSNSGGWGAGATQSNNAGNAENGGGDNNWDSGSQKGVSRKSASNVGGWGADQPNNGGGGKGWDDAPAVNGGWDGGNDSKPKAVAGVHWDTHESTKKESNNGGKNAGWTAPATPVKQPQSTGWEHIPVPQPAPATPVKQPQSTGWEHIPVPQPAPASPVQQPGVWDMPANGGSLATGFTDRGERIRSPAQSDRGTPQTAVHNFAGFNSYRVYQPRAAAYGTPGHFDNLGYGANAAVTPTAGRQNTLGRGAGGVGTPALTSGGGAMGGGPPLDYNMDALLANQKRLNDFMANWKRPNLAGGALPAYQNLNGMTDTPGLAAGDGGQGLGAIPAIPNLNNMTPGMQMPNLAAGGIGAGQGLGSLPTYPNIYNPMARMQTPNLAAGGVGAGGAGGRLGGGQDLRASIPDGGIGGRLGGGQNLMGAMQMPGLAAGVGGQTPGGRAGSSNPMAKYDVGGGAKGPEAW